MDSWSVADFKDALWSYTQMLSHPSRTAEGKRSYCYFPMRWETTGFFEAMSFSEAVWFTCDEHSAQQSLLELQKQVSTLLLKDKNLGTAKNELASVN